MMSVEVRGQLYIILIVHLMYNVQVNNLVQQGCLFKALPKCSLQTPSAVKSTVAIYKYSYKNTMYTATSDIKLTHIEVKVRKLRAIKL